MMTKAGTYIFIWKLDAINHDVYFRYSTVLASRQDFFEAWMAGFCT